MKVQNDKAKFKDEFNKQVCRFALDVIAFVDRLPGEQTSRIITDQLLRSTTSIGANVIEAQAASSRKDYTNFFTNALKSANGCKIWLGLFGDSGRGDRETINKLLKGSHGDCEDPRHQRVDPEREEVTHVCILNCHFDF